MTTEQERTPVDNDFVDILHGSVILHANTVDDFAKGLDLTANQVSHLETYDNNSLNSPQVTDWEQEVNGKPHYNYHVMPPQSKEHIALITHTRSLFKRIHWAQMRLLLGGEEGHQVPDLHTPISDDEQDYYLQTAQQRGLFTLERQPDHIDLRPDIMGLLMPLRDYGFDRGERWDTYEEYTFHPRFRAEYVQANIYKLACFLAVSQYATFEAQAEGQPIPANYVPTKRRWDVLDDYYQAKHNRPYPTMAGMYIEAHDTLTSLVGDKRDGIVDHVIDQKELSYLV